MNFDRSSGVLLHPTSLPGKYGIGTFGKEAYDFIDFLKQSGQKLWQTCPFGPTGFSNSPYQCFSAFAGNPLLISIEGLQYAGLLKDEDIDKSVEFDDGPVDYGKLFLWKYPVLRNAFENFKTSRKESDKDDYSDFCKEHSFWLDDYVLFIAIKNKLDGMPWFDWESDIKNREEKAMAKYTKELADEIYFQKFMQFEFFQQWSHVRDYANKNGVQVVGDIPLYVAHDSSDAWANPEIFQFDKDRNPSAVAGVPPDFFSATGQRWGNPLFDWDKLKSTGFKWWIDRIKANLKVADIIRIDHFRALAAYWSVPAEEDSAINGTWITAPGYEFFDALKKEFGRLPIIAEDLGLITDDVNALRDHFELPGMRILQFAFYTDDANIYLPHNYNENTVVYTGTHDNDTTLGWYLSESGEVRHKVRSYFGIDGSDLVWDLIKAAWHSSAVLSVVPMQDLLELGSKSRMNTPGKADGNWAWRYKESDLTDKLSLKLHNITENSGRL